MLQFVKKDARYQIVTIVKQSAGREIWIRTDLVVSAVYAFGRRLPFAIQRRLYAVLVRKLRKLLRKGYGSPHPLVQL